MSYLPNGILWVELYPWEPNMHFRKLCPQRALYSVKEEIFPMIKIPQKSNLIINSLVPFQFIFTLDMLDYHFRTLSLSLES